MTAAPVLFTGPTSANNDIRVAVHRCGPLVMIYTDSHLSVD